MRRSLRAELSDLAEPRYRLMLEKFVRTRRRILGVRIPLLRKTALRLLREGGVFPPLTSRSTYEELVVVGMMLARAPYPRALLWSEIGVYLDQVDTWIYGDVLAGELKQVKKDPESYWEWIGELLLDPREFHVRFAAVLLLTYYVNGDYIDDVLQRLAGVGHPGRYARMGAAWGLQRCYFAFPEKTLFVLDRSDLTPEIRRRAVQNIRAACKRLGKESPL